MKLVEQYRKARSGAQSNVIVEGAHAVKHALRFGVIFRDLFVTDLAVVIDLMGNIGAREEAMIVEWEATEIDEKVFARLAPHALRTGIVGRAEKSVDVFDASVSKDAPVVFLEDPHDGENVGAVVRVAAACGAAAVCTSGALDPWHADCIRTAAGLHFALPVCHVNTIEEISTGRAVLACDADGENMYEADIPEGAVFAFGTERYGLSGALKECADKVIAIPMQKRVSSLNLATSVAAVLYGVRNS